MKIYVNKKHRKKSIIGTVLIIPFFMATMPFGSFDPTEFGFWACIVFGLTVGFVSDVIYTWWYFHIREKK